LFEHLREIRFDLGKLDYSNYQGIKLRTAGPEDDAIREVPVAVVTDEATNSEGHKAQHHHMKEKGGEEDATLREGPEVAEGSGGRGPESSASPGKAKVAVARPSQLRIQKPGVAQSAARQRITDDANAKAKKMSVFVVGRLQKQFTRSMRQIEGGGATQAPVEGATEFLSNGAGNDTITSLSGVESDLPSPSGPSSRSA
jgi:hypothetical protein